MPFNTIHFELPPGWDGPDIYSDTELHGHETLANLVICCRSEWGEVREACKGPEISDAAIRRAIELAYHASHLTEEGQFLRFVIVLGRPKDWRCTVEFDSPIRLESPETLRKLSPAFAPPDCALLVSEIEKDGNLEILGACLAGQVGNGSKVGRPEFIGCGTAPELQVWVDGPGAIRVTDSGFRDFRLSAGHIQTQLPGAWQTVFRTQFEPIADIIMKNCVERVGDKTHEYFPGTHAAHDVIIALWSQLLFNAMNRRHGGTFILLPATPSPTQEELKKVYHIEGNHFIAGEQLKEHVTEFFLSCIDCGVPIGGAVACNKADRWMRRRDRLLKQVNAISDLSAIDGCVVLDSHLNVCTFGAKLGVDQPRIEPPPCPFANERIEKALKAVGTRHNSAARFCKTHPNTMAFVISQDGGLTIFYSNDTKSYAYERLTAWRRNKDFI